MGKPLICILLVFQFLMASAVIHAIEREESIIVYGEYPVKEELGEGSFEVEEPLLKQPLIDYGIGKDVQERAFIEALHFLNANVYGYSFLYKPGSRLLETEELFTLTLKGELDTEIVQPIAEGVRGGVYRVKIEFPLSPSMRKWLTAFTSNTLKLENAEGTSDFYAGWEGRSDAFREALRNLVLVTAKKRLSSKPLVLAGDILLKGNPTFAVGAGRYYCRVEGYVNIVELVTYD
jgi:hypothetical protein